MRLTTAAALGLVTFVGCSASQRTANDRAIADECEMMGPALDEIIGRAPAPTSTDCYARAGKLWKAEHELVVREVAYAAELREAARLAKPLAKLRVEMSAARADIAAQKQAARAAGCASLAEKNGATDLLRGYLATDMAVEGRRFADACRTKSSTLRPGEVKNFVFTAEAITKDGSGGAHDVVLARTARRLAKGVQR